VNKPSTKPTIREHKIPTPDSGPYIVVEGPDSNLWFCESRAAKIGCFNPHTGAFREFPLSDRDSMPVGIAAGADGNLWFTEKQANRVGRIWRDNGVRAADGESLTRRHRSRA
jgi:virginiamycin B lyase